MASPPMTAVPMAIVRRISRLEVEVKEARWYKPKPRVTDDRALAEPWGKRSSLDCCQDVAKILPRCCHVILPRCCHACDAHLDEGKNGGCPETWGQVDPGAEVRREDQGGDHPHLREVEMRTFLIIFRVHLCSNYPPRRALQGEAGTQVGAG